jgi:hypothetical protein
LHSEALEFVKIFANVLVVLRGKVGRVSIQLTSLLLYRALELGSSLGPEILGNLICRGFNLEFGLGEKLSSI